MDMMMPRYTAATGQHHVNEACGVSDSQVWYHRGSPDGSLQGV